MSRIKKFVARLLRDYENWKQSKCHLIELWNITAMGIYQDSINMNCALMWESDVKKNRKMQNLKHVHSGCCHIKVRREFRDTISCLAFNIPQLHLLIKWLTPTSVI